MTDTQTPTFVDSATALASHDSGPHFDWSSAAITDLGRVRFANEDAMLDLNKQSLWAVADGLGGLSRGDYASKAVIKALESFDQQPTMKQNIETIEAQLTAANTNCLTAFKHKKIGSTVAAFLAFGSLGAFIWAGDSRVYRLREGQLTLMTIDHSIAQEKVTSGEITADEARTHPGAHTLTRAVGVHKMVKPEHRFAQILDGDRYLVCTDGLHNDLSREEIQTLMSDGSPDHALQRLVELALSNGGKDNITAVMADARIAPQKNAPK